jgi:hypothetical protein
MILVETTHWPLVMVGAVPGSPNGAEPLDIDEHRLWFCGDVRLAVIIRGDQRSAWAAQEEVFAWLMRHRERLWRCVYRAAWIFEDELMRRNAEQWLSLVGDRIFRGEITTFRSVRSAISWLATDDPIPSDSRSPPDAGSCRHERDRIVGAERGDGVRFGLPCPS